MSKESTANLVPVTREMIDQLTELQNACFNPKCGDIPAGFPLLFDWDHIDRFRAIVVDGEIVSSLGLICFETAMFGCQTLVACLGAVCTAEAHRGRGLAGQLVEDAFERAADAGASLMIISGHRKMYMTRGSVDAGVFRHYTLPVSAPANEEGLEIVEVVSAAQRREALRLFEREPVCFRRTQDVYARQLSAIRPPDEPACTCLVLRGGSTRAVISAAWSASEAGTMRVCEHAGSRRALTGTLVTLARRHQAKQVTINTYEHDLELRDACSELGAPGKTSHHSGTIKLIDPVRLWDDFTGLIAARTSARTARDMQISPYSDGVKIHTLRFSLDAETLDLADEHQINAALWGHPELDPLAGHTGPLAEALKAALPLPLPVYGLNFV